MLVDRGEVETLRNAYDELIDAEVPSPGDRLLGGITRQVMVPWAAHPTFADNGALRAGLAVGAQLEGEPVERVFDMLIFKPPLHPVSTIGRCLPIAWRAANPTIPAGSSPCAMPTTSFPSNVRWRSRSERAVARCTPTAHRTTRRRTDPGIDLGGPTSSTSRRHRSWTASGRPQTGPAERGGVPLDRHGDADLELHIGQSMSVMSLV